MEADDRRALQRRGGPARRDADLASGTRRRVRNATSGRKSYLNPSNVERTATGQGPVAAESIVVGLIDEILTAFDADTTLSGMVSMVKPLDFDANYVDREIGDTRIVKFDVEAMVLVPSNM